MGHVIGQRGQVVISKRIRDELGIKPGWMTLQRIVDGHVELRFYPPEHNESLAAIFSDYARPDLEDDEAFHEAKEEAWAEAMREKHGTRRSS